MNEQCMVGIEPIDNLIDKRIFNKSGKQYRTSSGNDTMAWIKSNASLILSITNSAMYLFEKIKFYMEIRKMSSISTSGNRETPGVKFKF